MDSLSSTHLIATALVFAVSLGAWCMGYVARDALLLLFGAFTALAGAYSLKAGAREAAEPPSRQRRLLIGLGLGAGEGFVGALLGAGLSERGGRQACLSPLFRL